jgi:phenol 2-monooxygenase
MPHATSCADPDAVFDVRAVIQQYHRDLRLEDVPSLLLPRKGSYGLIDYAKAFARDWTTGADDIFDLRGIDREQGALVVARPDQYVHPLVPRSSWTPTSRRCF